MSDVVERLRKHVFYGDARLLNFKRHSPLAMEAADEIERLREALRPFADCAEQISEEEDDEEWAKFRLLIKDYRRAKAALKGNQ